MDLLILFLLVCPFLECLVTGANLNISEENDLKFERLLKLLNKPAIKSIKTEHGDLYDCVDFFKQPAFDHPLLKNTSDFQVLPPSILKTIRDEREVNEIDNTGLKPLDCPFGTVPIKRVTKEDLIKESLASKASTSENGQTHYAVVKTKPGRNRYSGAGAFIGIHKPKVLGGQYSSARLKVTNGPDGIQAGWRVDPILYHDTYTRLFIRTDAGQTHCFNTLCPGYVVVRREFPPDSILPNTSVWGENPFTIKMSIIRDEHGNWNLQAGPQNIVIGYWPARLFFRGLSGLATDLEWGGEVYAPGPPFPPMGLGNKYFRGDTAYCGFFRQVSSYNEVGQITDAGNLKENVDYTSAYFVHDYGLYDKEFFRHLVYYGGADQP